jgi:hypothetical protein
VLEKARRFASKSTLLGRLVDGQGGPVARAHRATNAERPSPSLLPHDAYHTGHRWRLSAEPGRPCADNGAQLVRAHHAPYRHRAPRTAPRDGLR